MLKQNLRSNFRVRITDFYKIKVVAVDLLNKTVKLNSDVLVVIPQGTILEFERGALKLTLESFVPDWATGSVDHAYTLESGTEPLAGDCTSYNDPITGRLKQYEQVTVLECSMRRIKEPVPESLAGVDHNALRLHGRILTPYNKPLKPGLYDAETEITNDSKSVGKFLIENNISDSILGHEEVLGTKLSGWFQSYLIKQS